MKNCTLLRNRRVLKSCRGMLAAAGPLSVTLLLTSCRAPESSRTPVDADSPLAPSETPEAGNDDKKELKPPKGRPVSFDEELAHISKIRKLSSKGPLEGLSVERADLLAHVEEAVEFETPPHALLGVESALVGLGLVAHDFDYKQTMLALLSERLAGMYQPRLKMMLVREGLSGKIKEITLLHELVHALQDQNFDVREVIEWHPDDTDRSSALSCLAEGDATSAMWDGILPEQKTAIDLPEGELRRAMVDAPSEGVPPILSRSLLAPYLDGTDFVHALRRRGGWEEVNRVWRSPPETTEQVLHLDKYDAREPAIQVPIPPLPEQTFRVLFTDSWGEQNLRLALEEWMGEGDARKAAKGWGGDRLLVSAKEQLISVTWSLVMDSTDEAQELARLLETHLKVEPDSVAQTESLQFCGKPDTSTGLALGIFQHDTKVLIQSAAIDRKSGAAGGCAQVLGWK